MSVTPAVTTPSILVEPRGAVTRLVLNRPPLNILDIPAIVELREKLEGSLGQGGVRLVEIGGTGKRAFCAGVEIRDHFPERAPEMLRQFHALIRTLLYAECPTLAVVRGHCLGGGMELALACDFIVASEEARFGQPEVKVGAFPPVASVLLPRVIPEKRALEMILLGDPIQAEEAHRLGLVNKVTTTGTLEDEVATFSSALLLQSPKVVTLARKAARLCSREAFESALRESERIYLEELLHTEDASEGLGAFLEKRPPAWKGR